MVLFEALLIHPEQGVKLGKNNSLYNEWLYKWHKKNSTWTTPGSLVILEVCDSQISLCSFESKNTCTVYGGEIGSKTLSRDPSAYARIGHLAQAEGTRLNQHTLTEGWPIGSLSVYLWITNIVDPRLFEQKTTLLLCPLQPHANTHPSLQTQA